MRLHDAMLADQRFRELCEAHGLPWDPAAGYEPRWYNGPAPEDVRVLIMMAEPGPITRTEALDLKPAISHDSWMDGHDLSLQEHYWRANLLELCRHVWLDATEINMDRHLGGSCTFWMSLPHGSTTAAIPTPLLRYFLEGYLRPFLALFSSAVIVAAGGKARQRLARLGVPFEHCWAFTRPGCNRREAHESWLRAGRSIRSQLGLR